METVEKKFAEQIKDKSEKIPSTKEQEKILSANIMFALEVEMNFKLYTYRIVDSENFKQRNNDLIKVLEYSIKEHKKSTK